LTALVHHPLGLETGLTATAAARLLESERRALRAASGVMVTSKRTVAAVEALGVPAESIAVVEPGTEPVPAASGSRGGAVHLLCVASLVPRKGHETLFDALMHLVDLDWRLTCVGSLERDTAYAATLVDRCNVPPLRGRVAVCGELAGAALEAAYESADLFVLPTHYEGYGMAVAEALARGIPVVSTPTGAIEDLVGTDAGVIVPPGDPEALAGALRAAIADPNEAMRLRQGALRARNRLPTWASSSERMEQALDRIRRR
jgi:glycosyltransferase involved in cell wall biosynthesis